MASARNVIFSPLDPNSAVEQIVRRIGEAIGSGVLHRGERLPPEAELASQLGVAPMTVRQALAILREAGFIETRRGRQGGSFVRDDAEEALRRHVAADRSEFTMAHLRDLTDMRRAVSGEAAALAALRCEPDDVARLRDLSIASHDRLPTYDEYRMADARFHISLAEVSRSDRLVAAETQIQASLTMFLAALPRTNTALTLSDDQHTSIVTAIGSGDDVTARNLMTAHVEATYDWIIGLRLGRLSDESADGISIE